MPTPNRMSSTTHNATVIAQALRMSLRGESVRLPMRRSRVRSSDQPLRSVIGNSASDQAALSEFTAAEERKLMHKIDRRLVLTVGIMYCISLMDRTNLGSAAIAG